MHLRKETLFVRTWALRNVLLLWLIRPVVLELNDQRCVIRIPLNWITRRRDIGAMYLGTLCMGADIASGLVPFRIVQEKKARVTILFKDISARFLKRAEGDVVFTCSAGEEVSALVERTLASGEREEMTVRVVATVPEKLGNEPVAEFDLTLSMKRR
ncbi:MAG TPA: DUF4442 domain-containing protein [Thermoanaerobaculia bacterium]|nr:DUF4442 domain-containing protein [Thermoanaerobaculia bacterium]